MLYKLHGSKRVKTKTPTEKVHKKYKMKSRSPRYRSSRINESFLIYFHGLLIMSIIQVSYAILNINFHTFSRPFPDLSNKGGSNKGIVIFNTINVKLYQL